MDTDGLIIQMHGGYSLLILLSAGSNERKFYLKGTYRWTV